MLFEQTLSDINIKRIRQSKPGGTWMVWVEDLGFALLERLMKSIDTEAGVQCV